MNCYIGVDLGGTNLRAAIADTGTGEIFGQRQCPTLAAEGQGVIEEFLQGFHPQDTALGEEGIDSLIGADQGPGVAGGRPGPGGPARRPEAVGADRGPGDRSAGSGGDSPGGH